MKDLHPQFELLIQYADGNADAEMQKQAANLIATDDGAAELYHTLLATELPFNEIAAAQADFAFDPAPQQKLVDYIKSAQPEGFGHLVDDHNSAVVIQSSTGEDIASNDSTFTGRAALLAMTASLFCGLIGGALLYGPVRGLLSDPAKLAASEHAQAPEWVRLVADYHRLYVRETITATSRQKADAVSQQVSETLAVNLTVPSLDNQGIEFRRAQWLAIDDQPLLQLAYLPESGKPLAICVLKKSASQNIAAEYGETGGMQYVHWQTGEHAIVIVGTVNHAELQEIHSVVEQQLL